MINSKKFKMERFKEGLEIISVLTRSSVCGMEVVVVRRGLAKKTYP